jgi:imidazole glycerol phosphate synthase subunit HisF
MEAWMIGGGVSRDQIAQKLICFGADGVDVFQGTKSSGVIKQIKENYAPQSIRVRYMAYCTNLVV